MHRKRTYVAIGLAAAFLAVSASSADARWFRHGGHFHGGYYGHSGYYGGGPGLVGGAVIGALTIATLPFAIIGSAVAPGEPRYQEGYGHAYGPPPPPPEYDRGYYGAPPPPPPPRGYYDAPRGYYGGGY